MSDELDAAEIARAAAAEAGVPLPGPDGAGAPAKARKTYPSPLKYENSPLARKLNAILDKADLAQPGDLLSKPAATCMVGECALATGEAMGLTGEGADEVPVHPGWLLLCAVVAYAAIIAFQHFTVAKAPPKPVGDQAQREAERASLV